MDDAFDEFTLTHLFTDFEGRTMSAVTTIRIEWDLESMDDFTLTQLFTDFDQFDGDEKLDDLTLSQLTSKYHVEEVDSTELFGNFNVEFDNGRNRTKNEKSKSVFFWDSRVEL